MAKPETRKKIRDSLRAFARWALGNTAWDFLQRLLSFSTSVFATWKLYIQPKFSAWLVVMDIPTIIAIAGMFFGFFVFAWLLLSGATLLVKNLAMRFRKSQAKRQADVFPQVSNVVFHNIEVFPSRSPPKFSKDNHSHIDFFTLKVVNKEKFTLNNLYATLKYVVYEASDDPWFLSNARRLEWYDDSNENCELQLGAYKGEALLSIYKMGSLRNPNQPTERIHTDGFAFCNDKENKSTFYPNILLYVFDIDFFGTFSNGEELNLNTIHGYIYIQFATLNSQGESMSGIGRDNDGFQRAVGRYVSERSRIEQQKQLESTNEKKERPERSSKKRTKK